MINNMLTTSCNAEIWRADGESDMYRFRCTRVPGHSAAHRAIELGHTKNACIEFVVSWYDDEGISEEISELAKTC